jgi:hypothetical protein
MTWYWGRFTVFQPSDPSSSNHLIGDALPFFNPRALLPLLLVACSAGAPGPGLDTDRVLDHVDILAKTPRVHDTDASRAALAYIESQVGGGERVPVGDVELPAIDIRVSLPGIDLIRMHARDRETVHTDDPDLLLRFGPPGSALLLTAHYDTVPGSPGAADNAVAVGILIELAHELRAHPPSHPVMLAFTADEEDGLVGAEAIAQRRTDIGFAVALDLVGGSGDLVLNGASTLIGAAEMRWLADAADRAGMIVRAPLPQRVVSRWWPQAERADHGAFTRRGIRAFHLYNRGSDGEWIDLAYHSAYDTPVRLDHTRIAELGRLVVALAAEPPPPHDGDGFWLPLAANTVVPRWTLVAFDLVLALIALAGLVALVGPRARGGAGLFAALGCYAVAIAMTTLVERVAAYPGAWLLAPLTWEISLAFVLAGALVLATRAVGRFRPWIGGARYAAVAIAVPLAAGLSWLAAGAAELAWIWLVPAAALALATRVRYLRIPAALIALLPAVLVLHPAQLREAAWNGFLPTAVPLSVWVGVLALPAAAAVAWIARRGSVTGPLGTLVLAVGAALAVLGGASSVILARPSCNSSQFEHFQLACTRGAGWP